MLMHTRVGRTNMAQPIGSDYFTRHCVVSDPDLSSDSLRVAFTFSWTDQESGNGRSRINVLDASDGSSRPFTQHGDARVPRWSPDGSMLAFLRKDNRGNNQVWLMYSAFGEARRLTCIDGHVFDLVWSPCGDWIAVVGEERVHDRSVDGRPFVADRIRYHDNGLGLRWDRHHIFLVDTNEGEITRISDGPWDDSTPVWSPDGNNIAFISSRSKDHDTTARSELYVQSIHGGPPDLRSEGLFTVGGFTWSPDGSELVAIGAERAEEIGGYGLICQGWLYALKSGKTPIRITDDSVRPVAAATRTERQQTLLWTDDDRIVFLADARGQSYVCSADIGNGKVSKITSGGCHITDWSPDLAGSSAAYVAGTPSAPSNLFTVELGSGKEIQRTTLNKRFLASHPPAIMEKFELYRAGYSIESRIWLPRNFTPSNKYPLLLEIHGGPHSVFHDDFYPIHQMAATAGYVVLAVNPRGSSSYGLDFARAVHSDWGGEDYEDIMAAVDEMAGRQYIDSDRMAVAGSSYGGFLSAWIVGHTNRFKAAVIGAPVTYLPSFYGTSDIGVQFSEVQLGGNLFDRQEHYLNRSPLTFAPNVTTPVLLIHGEDDGRVRMEQSEQYFTALKRLGKTVEFVRLPNASHGFIGNGPAWMRKDFADRTLAWLRRWLQHSSTKPRGTG